MPNAEEKPEFLTRDIVCSMFHSYTLKKTI